jgi:eukaryotic-like serine/threonine-protein kinase
MDRPWSGCSGFRDITILLGEEWDHARCEATNAMKLDTDDPRQLGDYVLNQRLGEGGQGVVYLARSKGGELVALKVLRRGWSASARSRFLKEAAAARRVASPHTARLIDADVSGDRPYIVSEYIDGPSLQQVVEDSGPMSGSSLQRLAVRSAMALAEIHRVGIVHRDVKPGNIVIGPGGAKMIDFGIAKALDSTTPVTTHPLGTPAYMAPEQVEGHPAAPATDVFAWGATMVFAATGKPPFGTGPDAAVLRRITERPPDLGNLDGRLGKLVADCLDKDARYRPTAAVVVRELRRPPPKGPRRSRALMLVLVIVGLAGFLLGVLLPAHG